MVASAADRQERVDPATALMREVGLQLRRVRLERGEDLDEIGAYLRIKPAYLDGIERGDLSVMPGRTYALGFLRSYADYLGFDGDDLIVQIKSTVDNLTHKTRLHIRTPLHESRLPKTPVLVLSLAAVVGIYAGWAYLNDSDDPMRDLVEEVPEDLRRLALEELPGPRGDQPGFVPPALSEPQAGPQARPEPALGPQEAAAGRASAAAAGPTSADETDVAARREEPGSAAGARDGEAEAPGAGEAPVPAAGPAGEPAAAPEAGEDAQESSRMASDVEGPDAQPADARDLASAQDPSAHPDAQTPELEPTMDGRARVIEPQNTDARVVLRGLDDSWIQIASDAGDYVHNRTLEPGDVFLVPNRDDLSLWTGNAGGLEISVDGRRLPPLGTDGAVLRDVPLDPDSLLAQLR